METGASEAGVHPVYFNNSVAKGGILAGLLALCLVLGFFSIKDFLYPLKKTSQTILCSVVPVVFIYNHIRLIF